MRIFRNPVVCQIGIAVILLLGLEGLCRIGYSFRAPAGTQLHAWAIRTPNLGWERRPDFNGMDLCGVHRTFDSRGLFPFDAAQLAKPEPEQITVLFVGDSNTYGYCLEAESTFVEVADRRLPRFRMINLGVSGYASHQGYKTLLKYGDAIKPDIVVASFNFNDRRYVERPENVDSDRTYERLTAASPSPLLEQVYLFRLAKFVSRKIGLTPDNGADNKPLLRLDALQPRSDEKRYKSSLRAIAGWAKERGAAAYFVLLGDAPADSVPLRAGMKLLEEENYAEAIKQLRFLSKRPRSGLTQLAQLYLSKAYAGAGLTQQAEETAWAQSVATVHGGMPVRLDTEYNRFMREVAQEQGVPLIDAKSVLNRTPGVYFDSCHFDARGHEIVGNLIADVLKKTKVLAAR